MDFFKDKQNLKNFLSFNGMNAALLLITWMFSYKLIPVLIVMGDRLGIDVSNFGFYSRLFPALTVLFVFVTNGLFIYSSPKGRDNAARLMLLPAIYLFAANAFALLLPFKDQPDAQEPFSMMVKLVVGFTLIVPALEVYRHFRLKKKADDEQSAAQSSDAAEDFAQPHLSFLPEAERKALGEAMIENCSPFVETREKAPVGR